jgi:hypothetical protein
MINLLVADNYMYGRHEKVLLLLVHFLQSSQAVWLREGQTEVGEKVVALLHWLSGLINRKRVTMRPRLPREPRVVL